MTTRGLVFLCLAYPAGIVLAIRLVTSRDPFILFSFNYQLAALLIVPLVLGSIIAVLGYFSSSLRWTNWCSGIVWIGFVTYVHYWFLRVAALSV